MKESRRRRRFLEGVFNQDLVVHKLSGLSALTYRDLKRHKIPRTATRDGGAPPPRPCAAVCAWVRVRVPPPWRRRACACRFQVLDLYSTRSLGAGVSVHAFLPGPGATPDAAMYTKENAPRRERGRKKASHLRVRVCVCACECVVLSFSCMLPLARVGE